MSIYINAFKKIASHFSALCVGGIFASSFSDDHDLGTLKLVDTRIIAENNYTAYASFNDCVNFSLSVCETKTLTVYVKKGEL